MKEKNQKFVDSDQNSYFDTISRILPWYKTQIMENNLNVDLNAAKKTIIIVGGR